MGYHREYQEETFLIFFSTAKGEGGMGVGVKSKEVS